MFISEQELKFLFNLVSIQIIAACTKYITGTIFKCLKPDFCVEFPVFTHDINTFFETSLDKGLIERFTMPNYMRKIFSSMRDSDRFHFR